MNLIKQAFLLALPALLVIACAEAAESQSRTAQGRVTAQTFAEIAALDTGTRVEALRGRLASNKANDSDSNGAFIHEAALRVPLRALVEDPKVGRAAIELLAGIGVPSDLEYVLAHHPKMVSEGATSDVHLDNRWAYAVATALINPESDAAWTFLEACASGDLDDRWVDAGALFSLSLSEPKRATEVLTRAAAHNEYRRSWIEKMITGMTIPSFGSLPNASPSAAASALAPVLPIGRSVGLAEPVYNVSKDKAQIDLRYRNGRDLLVYTATYHREADGLWHLRGVRETMQTLMSDWDADTEPPAPTTAGGERPASVKLRAPSLRYPPAAIRAKHQGTIVVSITVSADGNAISAAIAKSSSFSELDAAALTAVRGWQYHPALHQGKAVESVIELPLSFEIREG